MICHCHRQHEDGNMKYEFRHLLTQPQPRTTSTFLSGFQEQNEKAGEELKGKERRDRESSFPRDSVWSQVWQ